MSFGKGQTLPIRTVKCRECGATVQRKSYWRNPSCAKCTKERARKCRLQYETRLRQEARRYRILLAVGPYRTYEELYNALKIRNPKTWAMRFAAAMERRASA